MHAKILIDAIMRQTTVLIAQLSSTAGIRAPLAHLADEIFLNLSRELEGQGVARKVVADMFGMALRGYQRRVLRLQLAPPEGTRSLWLDLIQILQKEGPATRLELLNRFSTDDPASVGAVLSDLVQSGFVTKTGTGAAAVFALTPEESRKLLDQGERAETLAALVWLDICRHPRADAREISGRIFAPEEEVARAIERLASEQRVRRGDDGALIAEPFVIPVGAEQGWEVAVFDHFQAVAGAIAAKLRPGRPQAKAEDTTGGATLTFEVSANHPHLEEVRGLLAETRRRTDELWERVEEANRRAPMAEDDVERVVFYFGQFSKLGDDDA